jgi:2-isopropylmalate synthase
MAVISVNGVPQEIEGTGNGPINAFVAALKEELVPDFELVFYAEHSLSAGEYAEAIAYIQVKTPSGVSFFGAGVDTNIEMASIKAIVSSLNRAYGSLQTTPVQMMTAV